MSFRFHDAVILEVSQSHNRGEEKVMVVAVCVSVKCTVQRNSRDHLLTAHRRHQVPEQMWNIFRHVDVLPSSPSAFVRVW